MIFLFLKIPIFIKLSEFIDGAIGLKYFSLIHIENLSCFDVFILNKFDQLYINLNAPYLPSSCRYFKNSNWFQYLQMMLFNIFQSQTSMITIQ